MNDLSFGPIPAEAVHVCVDMQRIFLEPGPWFGEAGLALIGPIKRLASGPWPTLWTRFITAETPADATGCWRRYYDHWHAVTQKTAGADVLDLHPDLAPLAEPGSVHDKRVHDAFDSPSFVEHLDRVKPPALILSGVETDVCVLATALSAVDLGYRTIVVTDAVASSDRASHDACLRHIYPRFDQQIELVTTDVVLATGDAA